MGNISKIDDDNSLSAVLGSGIAFTGTGIDVQKYNSVQITLMSDVDSAIGGLQIQFSPNNTNWYTFYSYTYEAVCKFCKFFRPTSDKSQVEAVTRTGFRPFFFAHNAWYELSFPPLEGMTQFHLLLFFLISSTMPFNSTCLGLQSIFSLSS